MRHGVVRAGHGVELAYLEEGSGPAVVCLPGWSQAAVQFVPVISHLAVHHRVVAIDHRGHGRSSRPASGYRIFRLAADVHTVLRNLGLHKVTLLGHSMGVAVVWAYLELFGDDLVDRLVLADQRPTLLRLPDWTEAEARIAGASQTPQQMVDVCARLRSDRGWQTLVEVLGHMVSADIPARRFQALLDTNRPTTNAVRAALWFDQSTVDWRDLIPTISRPTLVVHGLASMIPLECQEWIVDHIPNARLATIPADAGGSHFAFWENPSLFADIVTDFLT